MCAGHDVAHINADLSGSPCGKTACRNSGQRHQGEQNQYSHQEITVAISSRQDLVLSLHPPAHRSQRSSLAAKNSWPLALLHGAGRDAAPWSKKLLNHAAEPPRRTFTQLSGPFTAWLGASALESDQEDRAFQRLPKNALRQRIPCGEIPARDQLRKPSVERGKAPTTTFRRSAQRPLSMGPPSQ